LDNLNPDDLIMVVLVIVPGLVVLYVRSYFVTSSPMKLKDHVLAYIIVTLIYWCILTIISGRALVFDSGTDAPRLSAFFILALVVGLPALLGLLLGMELKANWLRFLLQKISVYPVHVVPTAWDWKFGTMREEFVLIRTTQGQVVRGYLNDKSFVSSDSSERDIYVGQMYSNGANDVWEPLEGRSIWLRGEGIATIEFIKPTFNSEDQPSE
jgi:hypothetical protein